MATGELIATAFEFYLELVDQAGEVIEQQRISRSEFDRAIESTLFDEFSEHPTEHYQLQPVASRIEPIFAKPAQGSPQTRGFRVTALQSDRDEIQADFDNEYFRTAAVRMRLAGKRTQQATVGEAEPNISNAENTNQQNGDEASHDADNADDLLLRYRVTAFLEETESTASAGAFRIKLQPSADQLPVPLRESCPIDARESWDSPPGVQQRACSLDVQIDRRVLEDAVAEASNLADREVGGFLLGTLNRDRHGGKLFLDVSSMVSAADTVTASATAVTFTPESFAHVRNIIRLRGGRESIVGWYHSHPFRVCPRCPLPMPSECVSKILFYSVDDLHLMETTFHQPYMVGLLTAVEPRLETALSHLPVKLFGWRAGRIEARGFDVYSSD